MPHTPSAAARGRTSTSTVKICTSPGSCSASSANSSAARRRPPHLRRRCRFRRSARPPCSLAERGSPSGWRQQVRRVAGLWPRLHRAVRAPDRPCELPQALQGPLPGRRGSGDLSAHHTAYLCVAPGGARHSVLLPRPTLDADVLVDVRAMPGGLEVLARWLAGEGFELAGVSPATSVTASCARSVLGPGRARAMRPFPSRSSLPPSRSTATRRPIPTSPRATGHRSRDPRPGRRRCGT